MELSGVSKKIDKKQYFHAMNKYIYDKGVISKKTYEKTIKEIEKKYNRFCTNND